MQSGKTQGNRKTIKISTRLLGRVTSVGIKLELAALYTSVMSSGTKNPYDFLLDTVFDILKKWDKPNAKGLSQFIQDALILNIVRENNLAQTYKKDSEFLEQYVEN